MSVLTDFSPPSLMFSKGAESEGGDKVMGQRNYGISVGGRGSIKGKNIAAGQHAHAGDIGDAPTESEVHHGADVLAQIRTLTASIDEQTVALREASLALSQAAAAPERSGRLPKARFAPILDRLATSMQSLATLTSAIESLRHAVSRMT